MIGRLAWRSLTAHPVRSAVLAAGFGVGIGVMAILLGVAEVVLEQAQSPQLVGGGDVVVRLGPEVPARMVLSGTLQADALRPRVRVAAPFHTSDVYLLHDGRTTRVFARAGIPSLERALGDEETSAINAWQDSDADRAWTHAAPDAVQRQVDRFHPIPDVPRGASSWAEWLYFNGRAADARFYLTFLVGPRAADGTRTSGVRLQLERNGRMETYAAGGALTDADVGHAPDLTIGASSVHLDGMTYRIHLDLRRQPNGGRVPRSGPGGDHVIGEISLRASPGRLVPPIEIHGIRGWVTGDVVPVMSGTLDGHLTVDGTAVSLDGGTGYHDHNWGFWEGVSWQWGQVQQGDLSLIYGRVFPPREAADPEQFPGFVGALGPAGPLGYATNVQIAETNGAREEPRAIAVRARGPGLDVNMRFDVGSAVVTHMAQGPLASGVDFLQLRGQYTVSGRAGARDLNFTAPGAAETFRGGR
jgi:hypothetical protein